MSNLKYFTIILMEFHFIAFRGEKVHQNGQFLEIFQILTLRAAVSIFLFCLAH